MFVGLFVYCLGLVFSFCFGVACVVLLFVMFGYVALFCVVLVFIDLLLRFVCDFLIVLV